MTKSLSAIRSAAVSFPKALSGRPIPPCRPPPMAAQLVHRPANTLAFERRCIRSRFVALLHHTQRYASVARLAGAAHRRSRCIKLFTRRCTRSGQGCLRGECLDDCDFRCIASLPGGVFTAAGAGVQTNLLFFTKGKSTPNETPPGNPPGGVFLSRRPSVAGLPARLRARRRSRTRPRRPAAHRWPSARILSPSQRRCPRSRPR